MENLVEYASGCLWFTQEGDSVTIGVTEKGLSELGTIVELELPDASESYEEGDDMGAIHGRDGDLRLDSPMAFKVTERNHEVLTNPTFLEDDPTGDGWVLRGEVE